MRSLGCLLVFLAVCSSAGAQVPESERTPDTERWLGVAFVAEAGWGDARHRGAIKDHKAIFHVLRGRWERAREGTFLNLVKGYVAAFDPRTPKSGRVRWLLALADSDASGPPEGWPQHKASWDRHRVWWAEAMQRARDCLRGVRCKDPYNGRARHWGGRMDKPSSCMRPLPNAGTYNTFYSVDLKCARQRRRR
jgi:hypothetical protein